jgi:hypothetical protein
MSALDQKQTLGKCRADVRFTAKADIRRDNWNIRFVPKADILPSSQPRHGKRDRWFLSCKEKRTPENSGVFYLSQFRPP